MPDVSLRQKCASKILGIFHRLSSGLYTPQAKSNAFTGTSKLYAGAQPLEGRCSSYIMKMELYFGAQPLKYLCSDSINNMELHFGLAFKRGGGCSFSITNMTLKYTFLAATKYLF